MATVIKSVYKTRSNVISSTYKVGGVVSSIYKTKSAVVSSVYRVGSNIVKSVYRTQGHIIKSVYRTLEDVINTGVTSTVTDDCSVLVVKIDNENVNLQTIVNLDVSLYGSIESFKAIAVEEDGIISVNIPITSDGVYFLNISDANDVALIAAPLLVTCRIAKKFIKLNDENIESPTAGNKLEWLTNYIYYRGILSNYRTHRYQEATDLIQYLSGVCCPSC
jgi:hypothetical protein